MKKYIFFLLLSFNFIEATASEENTFVSNPLGFNVADLNIPNEELLEISTQVAGTIQVLRAVKKLTGHGELPVFLLSRNMAHFISVYITVSGVYSKSYLAHIYPSHNFW